MKEAFQFGDAPPDTEASRGASEGELPAYRQGSKRGEGPFSALSKPMFAGEYSLYSILFSSSTTFTLTRKKKNYPHPKAALDLCV